jgi:2,3-bisphosphoglycerate-dependent phosphoglycerate mutase
MHLYLVRHGECLAQSDPHYAADPDSPLSPQGNKQAYQAAHSFRSQAITHIVSSPLLRSLETAHIFADVLNLPHITVMVALREMWDVLGVGRVRADLVDMFPKGIFPETITDSGWAYGGDTHERMIMRAQEVIRTLLSTYTREAHIVVITHGFMINYLLHNLLEISPTTLHWFEHHNCGITSIRIIPEEERQRYDGYPPVGIEIFQVNQITY